MPPPSYCASYSSLPYKGELSLEEIFQNSQIPQAICPTTGLSISTPFNAKEWALHLVAAKYPSPAAASTLVKCLRVGVDLGFRGDRSRTQIGPNLVSANDNAAAIETNITAELDLGRRKGPFPKPPFNYFYSNPLGVVFKKGKSKPRVIHHLSWPRTTENNSVNASIINFDVNLGAFDQAVKHVREAGKNCFFSKIDVESAYRCIPVRPEDWPLLGFSWGDKFYFDAVMQFGITSATAIFEWYSSAAQYIAEKLLHLPYLVHYVDDFFNISTNLTDSKFHLEAIVKLFAKLGIPVSPKKLEGPAKTMIFLGILFDSVSMTLRLDEEKLASIHKELDDWSQRTSATKDEILSLIGALSFASKVVPPGRTFLRRMIDHTKTLPSTTEQYPLSESFLHDVQWWRQFMTQWNGVAVIPDVDWTPAHALQVHTDACVKGYAGIFGSHWFACEWTTEEEALAHRSKRDSMPFKELYALARAAATWGHLWKGRKILFNTDCQPNVLAWRKGDSKHPQISHLLRTLLFLAAKHDFNMNIVHIPGVVNVGADLLSRGQITRFLDLPGLHDPSPTTPLPLPTQTW